MGNCCSWIYNNDSKNKKIQEVLPAYTGNELVIDAVNKSYSESEEKQKQEIGSNANHNRIQCDTAKCNHFQRIKIVMQKYSQSSNLSLYNENANILQILNDFLHLLDVHSSIDEQFESISNAFGFCDVDKCDIFSRNYRNRSKYKNNQKLYALYQTNQNNAERISYYQILDKIHTFFHHCHDIGNRLLIEEQNIINNQKKIKNDDISVHSINNKLIKLHQILTKKRKTVRKYHKLSNRMSIKYNQLNSPNHKNMYCFGCEYRYDGTGEKYENNVLVINPKYSSLKEELTTNEIETATISVLQFNNIFLKAQVHFKTEFRKQNFTEISIQNLLSLMVYCNFDVLQYEFSKTYRE
eukprot:45765_1